MESVPERLDNEASADADILVKEPDYFSHMENIKRKEQDVFYTELENNTGQLDLNGRNLGRKNDRSFSRLSNLADDSVPEKIKESLEMLDSRYYTLYRKAENGATTPLPVDDNGYVILKPGQLMHNIPPDTSKEYFESISSLGLLASEWFGVPESEGEAKFCTFLGEIIENDESSETPPLIRFSNRKSRRNSIQLYFDMNNPVFQEIAQYDFFSYKVDKEDGTVGAKHYPNDLVQIYENLIMPYSPSMLTSNLKNPDFPYHYWKAIPGGIPPQLINGISINARNNHFSELVDTASKCFPSATIFDSDGKVLNMENPPHL